MNYGVVENRKYQSYITGTTIRGQIAKSKIYRVMPGNGYFGTIRQARYQQQYNYFVPSSINSPQGEPMRAMMKAAVSYWRTTLTEEEKKAYNERGKREGKIPGYNLFIKEALKGIYNMYVYRGDPASFDFVLTDFIADNTYRELDLSGIIPTTAKAIQFRISVNATTADARFAFKKYQQTNSVVSAQLRTQVASQLITDMKIVAVDENRKIEYAGQNVTWTAINFSIGGWWT